jgi:hypothetical protein
VRRPSTGERLGLVAILLLAWGLRWVALMEAPPGWRDDDLIELTTFSQRIVEEGPVLYFAGASGHEPLFHTLRAPLVATAGINQPSARWPSAVAGTLTVLLTWALGRRLFGTRAGLLAAALVAVSFWGLMYSRVAIRHIGALPWMLTALYWGWRQLRDATAPKGALTGLAIGMAGALLTYYAGRLMPVLLLALWPLAAPRRGRWARYLIGVGLGLLLAAPMFWAAAHIPGADARVSELAIPLHALQEGDPTPLLQTAWTTLGMFHARGDPEWLYNVHERPVFSPAGAALFYAGVLHCLAQWKSPRARFLLIWLAAGLSPALISLPPSSYGHTILALPVVYLILASLLTILVAPGGHREMWRIGVTASLFVVLIGARDISDYFQEWSRASMVTFLYRADYRALAQHLGAHPEIEDLAVGSLLFGPWDKVALATDLGCAPGTRLDLCARTSTRPRLVDPHRALVFANGETTPIYLQQVGEREPAIAALLASSGTVEAPVSIQGYQVVPPLPSADALRLTFDGDLLREQAFGGSLVLEAVEQLPGETLRLATWWTVVGPLPLPEEELIPNPPPQGVYNGPRLKVFAHLYTIGASEVSEAPVGDTAITIDDGLWVDPYTLVPGDTIWQIHRFETERTEAAHYHVILGVYDPFTGQRWTTLSGADHVEIALAP